MKLSYRGSYMGEFRDTQLGNAQEDRQTCHRALAPG